MGLSSSLVRFVRWRWSPTVALVAGALPYPLLVWVVVPASLWDLDGRSAGHSDQAIVQGTGLYTPPEFRGSSPSNRSRERHALAASEPGLEQAAAPMTSPPAHVPGVGEMPLPTRVEPPPVADPPGIPPSVELAQLIEYGVVEPGAVEFDFDPDHPVAGQVPDSQDSDSVTMPPPSVVDPETAESFTNADSPLPAPTVLDPPPSLAALQVPPSIRLTELIAQGVVEPGRAVFDSIAKGRAR